MVGWSDHAYPVCTCVSDDALVPICTLAAWFDSAVSHVKAAVVVRSA